MLPTQIRGQSKCPRALAEEGCECNSDQYTCHVHTFDTILRLLSSTVNNTKPRDTCQKHCQMFSSFTVRKRGRKREQREMSGSGQGEMEGKWKCQLPRLTKVKFIPLPLPIGAFQNPPTFGEYL